jgi:acyl dehydratase
VSLGEVLETPAITLTEAHAAVYRGLTGEPAGNPAEFPDLLALCMSIGLGWRVPKNPLAVLAFLTLDWQAFSSPRAGDTIHTISRTVVKRPMREGGIIVEERDVIDQRGALLQRGRFTFLVARRPPDGSC